MGSNGTENRHKRIQAASSSVCRAGRMVLTVFAGLAEFERELIRERTGAERIAAMKRGVRFGRPSGSIGKAVTRRGQVRQRGREHVRRA